MARKGFWQGGKEIGQEIDRIAASALLVGPTVAAERIVKELQQAGPSWTGRFSNSWQIEGPQGQTVRGDGRPGEPRPVEFTTAPFTGPQAAATLFRTTVLKDKIVFKISNYSDYADTATDFVEGTFRRPTPEPLTQLGKSKFFEGNKPREGNTFRWDVGSRAVIGPSSRTAEQDWLPNYASAGLNRAVQISMDAVLNRRA